MKWACRWFGHRYEHPHPPLIAVNKVPVFGCTRCGHEWWADGIRTLSKRDTFAPYRIATM